MREWIENAVICASMIGMVVVMFALKLRWFLFCVVVVLLLAGCEAGHGR